MEDIKTLLLDKDKNNNLIALKILRKQVIKGTTLVDYVQEILSLFATSNDLEIKNLILKVLENYLKYNSYSNKACKVKQHQNLFVSICLLGVCDKTASIRKSAIYLMEKVCNFFGGSEPSVVLDKAALKTIAPLVADTGSNLSDLGEPLETRGTLTIAEKAYRIISEFPSKTDFTDVFHVLIPALEKMHYYISNGIIDNAYGQKVIEKIINVFELLLAFRRVELPVSKFPEIYPNYLVELICFINDPKFHTISDTSMNRLRRQLIVSKNYFKDMIKVLELDDYTEVKISVLYLIARAVERGHSINYFIPQIKQAILDGKIEQNSIPDLLLPLIA
jgi:hypothetical protein